MKVTIPYGLHKPSYKVFHIDELDKSARRSKDYVCVGCNTQLSVCFGYRNRKHFKHAPGRDCSGGLETALHLFGKRIIVENNRIKIPTLGWISYSAPLAEEYLDTKKPDVTTTYDDKPLYFEIRVTNPADDEKKEFYQKGMHRCIEIDLRNYKEKPFEEIKNDILGNNLIKEIIYWDTPDNRLPILEAPPSPTFKKESFLKKHWRKIAVAIIALGTLAYKVWADRKKCW
ncbi:hypothetical protein SAMN05660841_00002 [Sphingobacterium nematocida]|uniref:Competence protein CoiA-like family protein n=1 Tax=Sphingobacterium nematocida TaxID=1513896 RepID=A0A1T5ALU7_9SPHI|nr:hypothetical protein [Sphingobacterium nematocida]SKB36011.1 hypothetical protein SAMN05660841_00002 [Sphingobacterium nematocida]